MEEGPASEDRLIARYGRRFAPGTVVFREGEPSDVVFLLQSGRIRLFKQVGAVERSLRVVRPGDLFGELALLSGARRQSTTVDDIARVKSQLTPNITTILGAVISG